jgi:MFS transporter, DHA2 family, multidrug resistance protein
MTDITAGAGRASLQGHRTATTICVMMAAMMQALDATIANVALPYMQGSLSATPEQANWVLTSYIVAAAIATPATGVLENRLGRRHLFISAVIGFVAASMLCGAARSLDQMVLFRLLQGLCGAPLVPLAQSVLLDAYPAEQRGSAMAIFGLGVMLGPIIGPSLGGWLTDSYNWRWVFYVNLPIGILTAAGLFLFLKEPLRTMLLRFDVLGFALLATAIASLQLFLDRGQQVDWFAAAEIWIELGTFLLAMYLFLVQVLTAEHPFLDRQMFLNRNFVIGQLLIFGVGAILLATLALLTPYLEQLINYPVLTAGLILAPRGFGTMASMLLVGRIIDRVGAKPLMAAGFLLTAHALHQMSLFTPDVSTAAIVRTGIVQGLGIGHVFVPLSTSTFATLPPRYRTQGTAFYNLMRNIGSSVGISVTAFLLTRYSSMMHSSIAENINPFRGPVQKLHLALAEATARASLDLQVTAQAAAIGYADDFLLMTYAALLLIPLVLLLRSEAAPAGPRPA